MKPSLKATTTLIAIALGASSLTACAQKREAVTSGVVAPAASGSKAAAGQPAPHKSPQTNRACILTTEQAGKVIGSPVQVQTLGHDNPSSDWYPDFVCAYANDGQRIHIQLGCNAPPDADTASRIQGPDGTVYGVFGDEERCFFILKVQVAGDTPEESSAKIAIQLDGQIRGNWSSRS